MKTQDWRDDPAPFVPGAKHHNLLNEDYWEAMFRVSYYRWAAGKPFVGRDPLTGPAPTWSPIHKAIERQSNIISARIWLAEAARLRTSSRLSVLDAAPGR